MSSVNNGRLNPRDSAKYVTDRANDVTINDEGIQILAQFVTQSALAGELNLKARKRSGAFPFFKAYRQMNLDQLINWTFLIDALNFSFWTPEAGPKYTVTHGTVKHSGYCAMVNAMSRDLDAGNPIYSPSYYGQISLADMQNIFRQDEGLSPLPLLKERHQIILSIANKLVVKYRGSFRNVLREAAGDAQKLLAIVVREFESFRDETVYLGKKISFHARAQMLVAEIDMVLRLNRQAGLKNIMKLTMFAEHRVPQLLVRENVLIYSPTLNGKIKSNRIFSDNDKEIVEIRGCTIEAVERLCHVTRSLMVSEGLTNDEAKALIYPVTLDFFLWNFRGFNKRKYQDTPFHKTRGIYY